MDELKNRNNNGRLTLLHEDTLWQDCEKFDSSFQRSLRNTTFLLQLIQSQVDCGRYATAATDQGLSISKLMEESSKKVNIHHSEKKVTSVLEPPSFLRDTRRQISVPVIPGINVVPLQLLLSTESLDANDNLSALERHLKGFVMAQHFLVMLMLLWTLQKILVMLRRVLPKS